MLLLKIAISSFFFFFFFHFGHLLATINHTIISLIPKVKIPSDVTQYRPISLYNTLYKIVSEVLVNKLKPFLSKCIYKSQSAFISGKQILDNVMIAHEYMHYLYGKRKRKQEFITLKLDMSKAYDRVK
ncbi:hypothetical protein ACH5RR_028975 [Cinchona calisaya]|uniref:Reverse transcriptase domain-containing protein n=1 Tax=Cinchona calisaya TaxID=153742 RepID=A0ABD2YTU3_9GENT